MARYPSRIPSQYAGLPLGCIIPLMGVFLLFGVASVAFEIWWKWTLIEVGIKYLHG